VKVDAIGSDSLDSRHDGRNTIAPALHTIWTTPILMINLGSEGGAAGGYIVAEGRPEQVAKVAGSHTGKFLAPLLAQQQMVSQHL
jgi:excinuclease ABC subunit A